MAIQLKPEIHVRGLDELVGTIRMETDEQFWPAVQAAITALGAFVPDPKQRFRLEDEVRSAVLHWRNHADDLLAPAIYFAALGSDAGRPLQWQQMANALHRCGTC